MTDGKIEIENGKGCQYTGNCGVLYAYKDGNLSVTKSLFGVRKYNSCNPIL